MSVILSIIAFIGGIVFSIKGDIPSAIMLYSFGVAFYGFYCWERWFELKKHLINEVFIEILNSVITGINNGLEEFKENHKKDDEIFDENLKAIAEMVSKKIKEGELKV